MTQWQLQEAKARLSQLVRLAVNEGPQEITVRGERAVVVLSRTDYEQLAETKPRLVDLLRRSPLAGVKLKIDRNRSSARRLVL